MERIGIYGGSFNPPHIGHIQAAQQAIRTLGLDKLLLIPAGIPPHKSLPGNTPTGEERLEMLRIAAVDESMEVCDIELKREGPSYTYETVEQLRLRFPDAELYLLMGTDMFLSFHGWKNPQRILDCVTLAVMYRGEKGETQRIAQRKAEMEAEGAKITLVENKVTAISSTQLRRLLAFGCAGAYLPLGVGEYIRDRGLYDAEADWKALPMEELEPIVVRLLDSKRVAHVLGCRDTAVELARRWGADENDAARAGLLHDITKALNGDLQLTMCRSYGTMLDKFSLKNPKTLHALTGSLVAERIFGENEAVVDAIRCHTTGKADMNLLEKIIYVADYVEPNRDFPGVEELRHLAYTDITKALKLGLQNTLNLLRQQQREISPESMEALFFLEYTGV